VGQRALYHGCTLNANTQPTHARVTPTLRPLAHTRSPITLLLLLPHTHQVDPRRRDPDKPTDVPPVRMPVVDVGGGQMDVLSRLLKDRILLLGQGVNDEVANVLVAQVCVQCNTSAVNMRNLKFEPCDDDGAGRQRRGREAANVHVWASAAVHAQVDC
jgi:hypothetical protein